MSETENSLKSSKKRAEWLAPYHFKPGQSGNPGGRKKNDVASEIARAIFSNNPEMIYQAFVKALRKGNPYAFQVLSDRAYGKVKETRELTHKYEDLSDADLQRRMDELIRDLGLVRKS